VPKKEKDVEIVPEVEVDLGEFEGLKVVAVGVEIPNAGGGLRDPMKLEPQEFRQGDRVIVALDCVVAKVRFEAVKKDDPFGPQRRVHVFRADTAAIVDAEVIGDAIAEQTEKLRQARERAKGVQRFDFSIPAEESDVQAERVRLWLGGMKRGPLRNLCDEFDVPYSDRTTAADLVEALVEHAPVIADRISSDRYGDDEIPEEDNDGPYDIVSVETDSE